MITKDELLSLPMFADSVGNRPYSMSSAEYANRLLHNLNSQKPNYTFQDHFPRILLDGFLWSDTPEGITFWATLNSGNTPNWEPTIFPGVLIPVKISKQELPIKPSPDFCISASEVNLSALPKRLRDW